MWYVLRWKENIQVPEPGKGAKSGAREGDKFGLFKEQK